MKPDFHKCAVHSLVVKGAEKPVNCKSRFKRRKISKTKSLAAKLLSMTSGDEMSLRNGKKVEIPTPEPERPEVGLVLSVIRPWVPQWGICSLKP